MKKYFNGQVPRTKGLIRLFALILIFSLLSTLSIVIDAEGTTNGWVVVDGNEQYHVDGRPLKGIHKIGSTTYLFNNQGNKSTGWHRIKGKEYYFDPNYGGGMITGKRKVGKTTYFFNNAGQKEYGWQRLSGKDYYFDPKYGGGMITGKRKVGKTTYLFNNAGYKEYGWHRLHGKEYYFDPNYGGGMITGKRKVGKTTYLFSNSGYKLYGWHRLEGVAYYFNPKFGGALTTDYPVYSGYGDDVINLNDPYGITLFKIKSLNSDGHFAVWAYSSNSDHRDLLVNTIGSYQGITMEDPYYTKNGNNINQLEIKADGPWEIEVIPLSAVKSISSGQTVTGTGDSVLRVKGNTRTATIKGNQSSHHFAVHSYGYSKHRTGKYTRDLLVNEIDPYSGTVSLQDPYMQGVKIIQIKAVGPWSIKIN